MQKVGPGSRGPEGVEQRSAGRRGHWVRRSLRCTADDNRKAAADSKQKSAEIAPGPLVGPSMGASSGWKEGKEGGGEDGSLQHEGEREEPEPSPLKTGSELRIVNTSLSIGSGIEGISITSRSRGPIMRICSVQNTVSIICQPIV